MMRARFLTVILMGLSAIGCLVASNAPPQKAVLTTRQGTATTIPCPIFRPDNVWNTPIDQLPADDNSATLINTMDSSGHLQAGFNSGRSGGDSGIPYMIVTDNVKRVPVSLQEAEESDHGPFPLPDNPPIENSTDSRLILLDVQNCFI